MFGVRLDLKRYEKYIGWIEERPVETGKILFYGDSFFGQNSFIYRRIRPERCKPILEEAVRMKDGSKAILNHGFGGSCSDDLLYYYHRLVRPYAPRALVLHIGSNDLGFGYSPAEVMERVGILVDWFQTDFPGVPIYLMNRTPGLLTRGLVNEKSRLRDEYNQLLEWYCASKPGCKLIRLNEMPFFFENPDDIGDYDKIRVDIHDPDGSHLNEEGYGMLMDYYQEYFEKEGLL